MELIKIEHPLKECMDDTLNENQCDDILSQVNQFSLSTSDNKEKSINEALSSELMSLGFSTVALALVVLIKWIKNKYSLSVNKLIDHSKELNDIYVKVDDILKHDKMARFKHRNDRLDYEIHYAVMKDKKDPRKEYMLSIDFLGYDPEYFINEINDIMKYVDTESKNKSTDLQNMKESLIKRIDESFNVNHGFVVSCEPMMKIEKFKNEKLEHIITVYKNYISNIYQILYVYNKYTDSELKYIQALQQAYNRMLSLYGKDKEGKKFVDEIFKKLINNITLSMDFNSKSMVLFDEMIKFYTKELESIYNIIRQ